MRFSDFSYVSLVGLVGVVARALRRGLPEAWRIRLEARPAEALPDGRWIWLHAVSVGELLLADGLLVRLREAGHRIHITTGTPAGLALMHQRISHWDAGTGLVSGGAFPLDDPTGLAPFLAHPPGIFVALETELWPNLLRELEARGIPRCVVNGRLTERSGRGGFWMRPAARRLSLVVARDEESLVAFKHLGAPNVELGGNLKADLPDPPPLHPGWTLLEKCWSTAPILVVGNTVEGEEDLALSVWREARLEIPDLKLILAPRQPRRFEEAASLVRATGEVFRRASDAWPEKEAEWSAVSILLLDTLGELSRAYALGAMALVAGGWRESGGHNPLEPLRFGVPTFIGPGYSNFDDLVRPLAEAGALKILAEAELAQALVQELQRLKVKTDGKVITTHPSVLHLAGALDRSWSLLLPFLPSLDKAPYHRE